MAFNVEPPFRLSAAKEHSSADGQRELWRLDAEVAVQDLKDLNVDLCSDEVKISFEVLPPLVCKLPAAVPRIDTETATCRFSRRHQRLSVLWSGPAPLQVPTPSSARELRGAAGTNGTENLDARIASLREECRDLAGKMQSRSTMQPDSGSFDDRLVKTVAAQISRLHKAGDETSDAEHLAMVIDTALDLSGRTTSGVERARLVLNIGRTFDQKLTTMRMKCFEQAINILDGVETSRSQDFFHLQSEALHHLGCEQASSGRQKEAVTTLQAAVDILDSCSGSDSRMLRMQLHHKLAEVCTQVRPSQAAEHLQAAQALCRDVRAEEATRAAELEMGFAAGADAKRLAIKGYSFNDEERQITIRIKLDDAIFLGASQHVTSEIRHLQVRFDQNSKTSVELQIAAPSCLGGTEMACWVLRLTPLHRPVNPALTKLKIGRGGSASMILHKEDALPWPNGPIKS